MDWHSGINIASRNNMVALCYLPGKISGFSIPEVDLKANVVQGFCGGYMSLHKYKDSEFLAGKTMEERNFFILH